MANIVTDLRPISSDIDHYNAAYGVWKQRSSHQKTSMNWIQLTLPSYVEQLAMLRNDQHIDILGVGSGAGMYIFYQFSLNWPRYFYSRWCPRVKKTTFPPQFYNEICTIYAWTIKNHNSEKKKKELKMLYHTVSKWWPNNRFLFCVISILAKIWKTTFPKDFFNEIWLKVGEYEYIYTGAAPQGGGGRGATAPLKVSKKGKF